MKAMKREERKAIALYIMWANFYENRQSVFIAADALDGKASARRYVQREIKRLADLGKATGKDPYKRVTDNVW